MDLSLQLVQEQLPFRQAGREIFRFLDLLWKRLDRPFQVPDYSP